jgi:hypothetical protein
MLQAEECGRASGGRGVPLRVSFGLVKSSAGLHEPTTIIVNNTCRRHHEGSSSDGTALVRASVDRAWPHVWRRRGHTFSTSD